MDVSQLRVKGIVLFQSQLYVICFHHSYLALRAKSLYLTSENSSQLQQYGT